MVYAPILLGSAVGGGGNSDGNGSGSAVAGVVLGLIGFAGWCALTIAYVKRNGQSIGKKLLGIKVVRADGTPVSSGACSGCEISSTRRSASCPSTR
jgi:uncharacterized RDD family membrane protein YckC